MLELSKQQTELVEKVGNPLVTEQGALTPYHLRKYWRPFNDLNPLFKGLYELGKGTLSLDYDFEPEAAASIHSKAFTDIHVIMVAQSNYPQEVPVFRKPYMNLKRVFHPELWDILKAMGMYTNPDKNNASFGIPQVAPLFEGQELIPPSSRPTANELLTRPFRFYHPGDHKKILGADPARFELIISGISDEFDYYFRTFADFIHLNFDEAFSGNKVLTYKEGRWVLREAGPQDRDWHTDIADAMVASGKFISMGIDYKTFPRVSPQLARRHFDH